MVLPFDFVEGSTCRFLNGALTGEPLPAPHGRIDVAWVELDAVTDAASTLGCDHRRAASQERIKHDVSTGRAVQNGISHQLDRRDRRLKSGQIPLRCAPGRRIQPRVRPHVRTVAAILAELDVVAVRVLACYRVEVFSMCFQLYDRKNKSTLIKLLLSPGEAKFWLDSISGSRSKALSAWERLGSLPFAFRKKH